MRSHHRPFAYDSVFFIALLATALALGGALAHAYELLNKIDLPREEYFVVQKAYRGWWQLAYVLAVQIVSITALIVMSRDEPRVFRAAVAALVFLAAAQAVFWIYTYPANVATQSWTTIPADWEALRRAWEYSHLVGAVCQLFVMSALFVGALARGRSRETSAATSPAP
jgi:hypothetical protein